MTLRKALKIFAFDVGVGALFALLLAKPFLGRFLGSGLYSVIAGGILFVASVAFVAVNWKALSSLSGRGARGDPVQECIRDAYGYMSSNIQTFRPDLMEMVDQLEKLQRKKGAIRQALLERFQPTELAFAKFNSASDRVELFVVNKAKEVLNKVNGFDEEEYEEIMNRPETSREDFRARKQVYDNVLADVADLVGENDKALLALDKLLMAISDISTIGQQQPDSDSAVREIDELIKDVKFYKGAIGN
ncbi:MAG: hypothetical protein LBQ12_05785 [Deltaproteobacteria bacterium]|jgi:archaellum component FlaC|nr:hypothetical protein [Deltaproteobacteria bacterium]